MAHFPPRSTRIADLEDGAENLEPQIALMEEQLAALIAKVDALVQQQQNDENIGRPQINIAASLVLSRLLSSPPWLGGK